MEAFLIGLGIALGGLGVIAIVVAGSLILDLFVGL